MSGNFIRSKENGINKEDNGGNSYYTIINHGDMIINSKVSVKQNGKFSSLIENGWYDGSKNTEGIPSRLNIVGGTFIGGLNTIKNDDYGILNIGDGVFSNTAQAVILNWNIATINGGKFIGSDGSEACILNKFLNDTMDKGILTINDGKFIGSDFVISTNKTNSKTYINGGKFIASKELFDISEGANLYIGKAFNKVCSFNKKVEDEYLLEGYELLELNEEYYVQKVS